MHQHVCMLTSVHTVWDTRIFHREAKTLRQAGFQVTLIATGVDSRRTPEGIDIIGLNRPRWRVGRALNWPALVKIALNTGADIYHFHDPDLLLAALFLQKYSRKPVIYDNHDPYVEAILAREWLPFWLRPLIAKVFDPLEKYVATRLTATIVANDIQLQRFPQATLISNYPDLIPFQLNQHPPRDPRTVVYAGSLSEARGMFDLVAIARLLRARKITLHVLGPFPNPALARQVTNQVEAEQLTTTITFTGRVPHNQIIQALKTAAVGLIPFRNVSNHQIIIPTKLFEYMACALPVVASDLPPIRRYVTQAECGLLVPPDRPQAFAEAVEYLLDHPEEANRLGRNGRQAVLARYNWQREGPKLLSLYRELL
jgi:glycosyltransferase involved in cell wall biosynthesis